MLQRFTSVFLEISMGDEGTLDSSVDFQAIVDDEPQFALDGVLPSLTPRLPILYSGFANTLPEGARLPISDLPESKLLICTAFP